MDVFDKDCLSEVISYLTASAAGRLSISCKALSGAVVWNCVRVATVKDDRRLKSGKYATWVSCSSDNDEERIDLSHIWKDGSEIRFTGLRSLEVKHARTSHSAALLFAQMVAPQLRHFVCGDLRSRDITTIELNPEIFESGTPTNVDVVWKNLRRLELYAPFAEPLPRAPKLEQLVLPHNYIRIAGVDHLGKAYPSAKLIDLGNDTVLDLDGCSTQEDFDARTREILGFPADRLIYSRCLFWAQLPVDFPAPQKFIDKCHENMPPSTIFATFQEMLLDKFNRPLHLELIDTQLQRSIKSVRRCSQELVMPFIIHTIMQLQTAFFIHKGQFPSPGYPMERARFWMDQFEALFPLRCFDAWKMWLRVTSSFMQPWMGSWFDCCRTLSPDGSIPFEDIIVPASMEYVKRVYNYGDEHNVEFAHSIHTSDFFPWDLKTNQGKNLLLACLSRDQSRDIERHSSIVPLLRGLSSRGLTMQTDIPWSAVTAYLVGRQEFEDFATLAVKCYPASIFVSAEQQFSRTDKSPMAALKLGKLFDAALTRLEAMPPSPTLTKSVSVFYRTINRLSPTWICAYRPLFAYISLTLSEKLGGENVDAYAIVFKETDFRISCPESYRRFLLGHVDGSGCFPPEREFEIKKRAAEALGMKYAEGSIQCSLFESFRSSSSVKDLPSLIDSVSDEVLCLLERSTCCSLLDLFVQKVHSHRLVSSPELHSIFQRLLRSGCIPTRPCNLIEVCHSLNSDPSTVALALERQLCSPDSLRLLSNMLFDFLRDETNLRQLIELLGRPEARMLCRNKRKVAQVAADSAQESSSSSTYTPVPESDPARNPNALLEYLVKFTEPFFDCLHDAHAKCESSNDVLSWVEEILLTIAVMDWDRVSNVPDKVEQIWRRILMFQDRTDLSNAERLFRTKESDFPLISLTERLLSLSAVYDSSTEELHWDYLKMQGKDRKSPMSVVLTSRFSRALFNGSDAYSDRTHDSLVAALFPSDVKPARETPYQVVVDQLSKISKEIDGIVELPPSLRVLLASSPHPRPFYVTSTPASATPLPPSDTLRTHLGGGTATSFGCTPENSTGMGDAYPSSSSASNQGTSALPVSFNPSPSSPGDPAVTSNEEL